MPTIICNHCQYVGNGADYQDRINDVEDHEKTCSENPDYTEEAGVDDVLSEPWEEFDRMTATEQLQRKMDELIAIVRADKKE